MISKSRVLRLRLGPVSWPFRQASQERIVSFRMPEFFEGLQVAETKVETRAAGEKEVAFGELLHGDCPLDLIGEGVLRAPLGFGEFQSYLSESEFSDGLSNPSGDLEQVSALGVVSRCARCLRAITSTAALSGPPQGKLDPCTPLAIAIIGPDAIRDVIHCDGGGTRQEAACVLEQRIGFVTACRDDPGARLPSGRVKYDFVQRERSSGFDGNVCVGVRGLARELGGRVMCHDDEEQECK